jgi:hypothetical protein
MPGERRSGGGHRIEIEQRATLIESDGRTIPIVVKDLSRDGFRVQHAGDDLLVEETVRIETDRGTCAVGRIKWVTANEAGGVFIDLPDEVN